MTYLPWIVVGLVSGLAVFELVKWWWEETRHRRCYRQFVFDLDNGSRNPNHARVLAECKGKVRDRYPRWF